MKKQLLILAGVSAFLLGACGNEDTAADAQPEENTEQQEQPSEETAQQEEAPAEEENKLVDDNGNLITPNTIETNNAIYDIKDIRIGKDKNFDGKSIAVIEMDFTNKQQDPNSPWMTFVVDFDAQQTDGTTTTTLNGANGQMPSEDPDATKMGDANVNSNAKVHAIIGYTIEDDSQPIFFSMRFDPEGKGFYFNKK